MKKTDIQPGALLTHGDRSTYDIWKVTDFDPASGHISTFNTHHKRTKILEFGDRKLRLVNSQVSLIQDADALVDAQVRLLLTDGGVAGGLVTAVNYRTLKVNGKQSSYVVSIELEHSMSTTYKLSEISSIEKF